MSYRIEDFTTEGIPYPFGVHHGKTAAALLSDDAGAAEGPMRRRVACRATCVEAKP